MLRSTIPPPYVYGLPADKFGEWRQYQAEATVRAVETIKRFPVIVAPTGFGKCLRPDTFVLTYDGRLVRADAVQVGDSLMGPDSLPRWVLATTDGVGSMYEIRPVKGEPWACNSEHVLTLKNTVTGAVIDVSLRDYLSKNPTFKHEYKLFSTGVDFMPREPLPLSPYFLGLWFGDGTKGTSHLGLAAICITKPDVEVEDECRRVAAEFGLGVRVNINSTGCPTFCLSRGRIGTATNGLLNLLRLLIGPDVTVPRSYLVASSADRLEFLAGWLDSDGYHNGSFEITQKRKDYADAVLFLARSLGFKCVVRPKIVNGTIYHRMCISGDLSLIPTRILRKQAPVRRQIKDACRTGFAVVAIGDGEFAGFSLSGDGRFLLGDFTVTHNSAVAESIARYAQRSAYLTITKALQDQLSGDFADRFDLRGKSNYDCRVLNENGITGWRGKVDQAEGLCEGCEFKERGCRYYDDHRAARQQPMLLTNYAKWLATDGDQLGEFDTLVCDECFVAGTLVDGHPIETIRRGDKINAYDAYGEVSKRVVRRVFRSRPNTLVRVVLEGGRSFVCTKAHPFLTRTGWRPAIELVGSFVLDFKHAMRDVPEGRRSDKIESEAAARSQKEKPGVLQSGVLKAGTSTIVPAPHEGTRAANVQRPDAQKESDAFTLGARKDENIVTGGGVEASNTGRQWAWTHCRAAIARLITWLGYGDCRFSQPTVEGVSDALQNRHSEFSISNWNRSRRCKPSVGAEKETRLQKGKLPSWIRVDCVEVLQSTSDGTFGGLCPDGYVYNLEVELAHTYLVDGVVVHNCHGAADQLSKSMRIELDPETVERFTNREPPAEQATDEWQAWAGKWFERLGPQLDALASRVRAGERNRLAELRQLRGLVRALDGLRAIDSSWLEDRGNEQRVGFEPLWPRRYGERLWRGTKRVVLMSATITRKDLAILGVKSDDVDFAEYPSSFPVSRRPIISVQTVVQRASMSEDERLAAVRRVDQIIDHRLDRKGIIHTVSFDRARHLAANSRHRGIMMVNDPSARNEAQSTKAVVERFRRASGSAWLVTPSAVEGWDFSYSQCECIVLYKVPLLNRHASRIADARCKEDGEYDGWQAMKKVVQMFGRAMRAADDRCEGLIIDDTWDNWFLRANKRFAPNWFLAAVRGPEMIPRPLEKLSK